VTRVLLKIHRRVEAGCSRGYIKDASENAKCNRSNETHTEAKDCHDYLRKVIHRENLTNNIKNKQLEAVRLDMPCDFYSLGIS
jgi:hypothetical protein